MKFITLLLFLKKKSKIKDLNFPKEKEYISKTGGRRK